MPNTQQKLIEEAVERFFEKFTYGGITGRVVFAENKDRPYEVGEFFRQELSLIARKSGEEGRKQGVAQAVSLFMGKIKSLSQDVLLEALANPKEL